MPEVPPCHNTVACYLCVLKRNQLKYAEDYGQMRQAYGITVVSTAQINIRKYSFNCIIFTARQDYVLYKNCKRYE